MSELKKGDSLYHLFIDEYEARQELEEWIVSTINKNGIYVIIKDKFTFKNGALITDFSSVDKYSKQVLSLERIDNTKVYNSFFTTKKNAYKHALKTFNPQMTKLKGIQTKLNNQLKKMK